MVTSRICTIASSMNTSRMPVWLKSSSVVSKVTLAAGFWPRPASTARAVDSKVPPTQNPRVLICSAPLMSRTTSIARMTASSMYWSQVTFDRLSSGLRQLMTNTRWPCATVWRISELSGCRSRM